MPKKKDKEKTLEAKETREEKISEDEKKKMEERALKGMKLDKPLEEKAEEKIEEEVGKIVEAEGLIPEEKIVKEAAKGAKEEKEKVEGEKAVEGEGEVESEGAAEIEKELEVLKEEVKGEEIAAVVEGVEVAVPIEAAAPVREYREEEFATWKPKTELGKLVASGTITDIDEILKSGQKIREPEIVDKLVPDLKNELILIGGRKGKGGGKQRIPVKLTATMHRSGRRFTTSAFIIVGNEDGLVGIGKASAVESRTAIDKAVNKAKTNIIRIKRGCGSWECGCGGNHSVPYKTEAKSGSVRIILMPAPKGIGLVADDGSKIILRLAGVKDVWVKTYGNTKMRINLITALFKALKKLYVYER